MDKRFHFEGYVKSYLDIYLDKKQIKEIYNTEFYKYLLDQVLNISFKTILIIFYAFKNEDMLVGNTSEERYNYFDNYSATDEFHDLVYKMYPLLCRRLGKILDNHIINYNNLMDRLERDRFEILDKLNFDIGNIDSLSIKYGNSDFHRGAKTVCIIEKDDKKIVYKPRAGNIDTCWKSFIDWFNSKNPSLKLKANKVIDKEEYCWQNYIENEACESEEEVKKLYYRVGILSSIAYALKIEDLHMENIIVSRDFPYIVDLETIFQVDGFQNVNLEIKSATDIMNNRIIKSILSTQLFPMPNKLYDSTTDISGITGKGEQVIQNGKFEIINKYTDELYVVRTDGTIESKSNIGIIGDSKVNPQDYIYEIIEGFREGYKLLMDNSDELSELIISGILFKDICPRYLFRNTNLYAIILEKSKNPEYLKNESELNRLYGLLFDKNNIDNLENVYRSEIQDLFNDDIPYFYGHINEKHIYNSNGEISFILNKSPLDEIIKRITNLNNEDMNMQTELISIAMKNHKKTWNNVRSKEKSNIDNICLDNTILIDAAKNIGDILIKNGITHEKTKTMNWFDIQNMYPVWKISSQDIFLYNGLAGNAIFFSTLYDTTKDIRYKNVLDNILNTINIDFSRIKNKNASAFNGVISLAYLYAFLYKQTNDENMLKNSVNLIKRYKNEIIQTESYDIVDGLSGILAVVLGVYELSRDIELKDLSQDIAENIVSNIQIKEKAAYWKKGGKDELMIAGFSHGLAGVTYALGKLKEKSELIDELIKIENKYYKEDIENWIDLRSNERLTTNNSPIHWCHGAAGIGLSRLKIKDITYESKDIDVAVNSVIRNGLFRDSDCLCHGNLGNVDLLLELYKSNGDINIYNISVNRVIEIIKENKDNGKIYQNGVGQKFNSPGLMLGLSGIGYQILRLVYPDKYPSVLLLEV